MHRDAHSVLIVVAHCDDAELWAGGTIRRYVVAGWGLEVAILRHTPDRRLETEASARIMEYKPVFLPDGEKPDEWLIRILKRNRPEVLLTHQRDDPHPEHQWVHRYVVRALTRSLERRQYPRRWYLLDSYYLTRCPSGCPILVDISDEFQIKREALRCHASQNTEELISVAEAANTLHGHKIRVGYAEAFYAFDLLGRWPRLRDLP